MDEELIRYTLRTSPELMAKLGYIAEYRGRTKNKQIEQLIIKCVAEFEAKYGEIDLNG